MQRGGVFQHGSGVRLFRRTRHILTQPDPVVLLLAQAGRSDGGPEPAYHNRAHIHESVRAMRLLCGKAVALGLLSARMAELGVIAMAGHDLGHDGSAAQPGVLEARAAAMTDEVLHTMAESDRQVIRTIILATAPALVAGNAARAAGLEPAGPLGVETDLLCALANEADVLASLLPDTGPDQARLLAEEWRQAADPRAATIATFAGRLAFLRVYRRFSAPARAIGLADVVAAQICVLESRAAEFDALPFAQARERFLMAVRPGVDCLPRL